MKKRVLLVDDTQDIVTVMKFILEKNGFEVVVAYDGIQGLQKAHECKPDIVILDIKMPNMSGEELAEELAKDEETAPIPLIFLSNVSGIALRSLEDKHKDADSQGKKQLFLSKSCSEEELISAIQKVLTL